MAGGLDSLNLAWCYTKRIRRPYYTGARVAIFVGRIEYERALKLITAVYEFVQVFSGNLQYIEPMDVAVVHGAVSLYPLHDFHSTSPHIFVASHELLCTLAPTVFVLFQALGEVRVWKGSACARWMEV